MKKKKEQFRTVHLKFSEGEILEIDNWQEMNRVRTRSEAIRQMIRITLAKFAENSGNYNYGLSEEEGNFIPPSQIVKKQKDNAFDIDFFRKIIREEIEKDKI